MSYHSQIPPHIIGKRREISVLATIVTYSLPAAVLVYLYPSVRISEMFMLFLSPWTDKVFQVLFFVGLVEFLTLEITEWVRKMYDEMGEWSKGNIVFALQSGAIAILFLVDTFYALGFVFGQWFHASVLLKFPTTLMLLYASITAVKITTNVWLRA